VRENGAAIILALSRGEMVSEAVVTSGLSHAERGRAVLRLWGGMLRTRLPAIGEGT
jgi:hypothetical protein